MEKSFTNTPSPCRVSHAPSSRSVSVRDIKKVSLPKVTPTLSFPKVVIGNPNLIKDNKAAEVPDKDTRGRHYMSAFTLIELLVVVLIIGILAAIALPQYQKAVEKVRLTEAMTNLKYIRQILSVRYLENPDFLKQLGQFEIKPQDFLELSGGHWGNGGSWYCTKHFVYDLGVGDMYNEGPGPYFYARAYRSTDIGASCGDYATDRYTLEVSSAPQATDWSTKTCWIDYNDIGRKICKSLESQGFTAVEMP